MSRTFRVRAAYAGTGQRLGGSLALMATAYSAFPDLQTIAFRLSDGSNHQGGGHCAGLPDESLYSQWELVVDQHVAALSWLVDKALDDEDGWALTRPILFAAHHVCEVALKMAWVGHTGQIPKRGHPLEPHWARLGTAGGLRHLDAAQINEAGGFIKLMAELTPDGQTARYPMLGVGDVGTTWCCLNSGALRDAVYAFISRLEPQ